MTDDQSVEPVVDEPETDVQIMTINVGGKDHPLRFVPQCDTCNSPAWLHIERLLIEGNRPAYVLREVARIGYDPIPSIDSLYKHIQRRHTSVVAERNQRIIEKTAEALGKVIDESAEQEIHMLAMAQKVVDIRGRDFMDGTEKPSDAVLKMSVDLLRDADARIGNGGTITSQVYQRVIDIILEIGSDHARDSAVFVDAVLRDSFVASFARALRGSEEDLRAIEAS